jgi:hypothetical protein
MKKNLPLITGIALPIIFIAAISIVVFASSLSIRPQHDFIYSLSSLDYYHQDAASTTLYLYDLRTNSSHQIASSDVSTYALDPGPSSPDGYTVQYEYNNDGLFDLFGSGGNDSGYFIEKGGAGKKLTGMAGTGTYYQGDFKLVGWVK